MKITKQQLKQIIKEEIDNIKEGGNPNKPWDAFFPPKSTGGEISTDPGAFEVIGSPSAGVSIGSLWRDLNVLLENWTDHEHPYYQDLYNLMEDYSTSPDRPTRLPLEET